MNDTTIIVKDGQLVIPMADVRISDGYHTFEELYDHRGYLFLALLKCMASRAWVAEQHSDGTMYPNYFIAGLTLPTGTVTYHLSRWMWSEALQTGAQVLERAPQWDGHTPAQVLDRLIDFICEEDKDHG